VIPALVALASRLRQDAEVAETIASRTDGAEQRRWVVERETYLQAAAIVGAAAEFRDGVSRIRTVVEMHQAGNGPLPRETWLRVGVMVELSCPARRPMGVVP
jgi:hypothetical protein